MEQIDLNFMLNATESICSALGFKLGKSREAYVPELQKMPWTSNYLASLKLDVVQQGDDLQRRILYALYYRPNGLKWKDLSDQQETIECPERVVRKNEQPMHGRKGNFRPGGGGGGGKPFALSPHLYGGTHFFPRL